MPESALFVFDGSAEGRTFIAAGEGHSHPVPEEIERFSPLLIESGRTVSLCGQGGDWWGLLAPDATPPDGYRAVGRRELPDLFGYDYFIRAGVAYQMMNLQRNNRFCGTCGSPMTRHQKERAVVCEACGRLVYPALSPAIIVAVEKDGMLLMGHGANFPSGRYSVLAGFVEPGETLEDAVVREICEEAGVAVKNIRYFGSQPWPFPSSMMLGFKADWESGEPVADGEELSDVRWFTPDELPDMPPSVSISRQLIDDWLDRRAQK